MSEVASDPSYESHRATYCESCGRIEQASDSISESVEEPVHRVDILEALDGVEGTVETVAEEVGDCELCGGQLVKRWYITGEIPECEYEPPEDYDFPGRDPDEDALIGGFPEGSEWREAREISWIKEGSR